MLDEGYNPEMTKSGDLTFSIEGTNFVVYFDNGDEVFFCLVVPSFFTAKSKHEMMMSLYAANCATASIKVAKVYLSEDMHTATAAYEMFYDNSQSIANTFGRAVNSLRAAIERFYKDLSKGG